MENCSVFTHLITVKFLKSIVRTFLLVSKPTPAWDLNLVLSSLINPPFKSLAFYIYEINLPNHYHLSQARRWAWGTYGGTYLIWSFKETRSPWDYTSGLSPRFLLTFTWTKQPDNSGEDRRLQSLDVHRGLAFYMNKTQPFQSSQRLCICIAEDERGSNLFPKPLKMDFQLHLPLWACGSPSCSICQGSFYQSSRCLGDFLNKHCLGMWPRDLFVPTGGRYKGCVGFYRLPLNRIYAN